jgi:subtilisin family serine protease
MLKKYVAFVAVIAASIAGFALGVQQSPVVLSEVRMAAAPPVSGPAVSPEAVTADKVTKIEVESPAELQEPELEIAPKQEAKVEETAQSISVVAYKTADDVAQSPDETVFKTMATQPGATWGLDSIDGARDGSYNYVSDGAGVRIYIVDTGVDASHPQVSSRVVDGFDAFGQNLDQTDCNGHGTHVAGIAAGSYFGVAKAATIVPVRVMDCSGVGNTTTLTDGIDWILASHSGGLGIVNMSLGGNKDAEVNSAVSRLVSAGLVVVAAAGNSNADACNYSPASAVGVIAVGATDQSEAKASFSNWGSCVDITAPGVGINSANSLNHNISLKKSGTSQAAPFVAGAIATYISNGSVSSATSAETYMDGLAVSGAIRVEATPEPEPEPPVETTPEPTPEPEPVTPEPEPIEPPVVDEPIVPEFEVWVEQVAPGSNKGALKWSGVSNADSYEIHKTSNLRPGWRLWDVVPGDASARVIVDKPGVTAVYKVVAIIGSTRTEIGIFIYEPVS